MRHTIKFTNITILLSLGLSAGLAACGTISNDRPVTMQKAYFDNIKELCGKSFKGKLVSDDPVDEDFKDAEMIMHVRECKSDEIRIPFNVDNNRSRVWILKRDGNQISLKHQHTHKDGSLDKVTNYGGVTINQGTAHRQEFPADDFSVRLFRREGLEVSVDNIWSMDIVPEEYFAYDLRRENRHFRVEFDLSKEVLTPPASWDSVGYKQNIASRYWQQRTGRPLSNAQNMQPASNDMQVENDSNDWKQRRNFVKIDDLIKDNGIKTETDAAQKATPVLEKEKSDEAQ